jgi:hypothetical protein
VLCGRIGISLFHKSKVVLNVCPHTRFCPLVSFSLLEVRQTFRYLLQSVSSRLVSSRCVVLSQDFWERVVDSTAFCCSRANTLSNDNPRRVDVYYKLKIDIITIHTRSSSSSSSSSLPNQTKDPTKSQIINITPIVYTYTYIHTHTQIYTTMTNLFTEIMQPGGGVILIPFVRIIIALLLVLTIMGIVANVARIHMIILSLLSGGLLFSLSMFEKEFRKAQGYHHHQSSSSSQQESGGPSRNKSNSESRKSD